MILEELRQIKLTPAQLRLALLAMALLCIGALIYAWTLQYGVGKQQPCPLCILQRYAYAVIAVIALLGVLHGHARYALLTTLPALAGVGLAVWQVGKGASMTSCREDPVGVFVNGLPMANWWPEYLFATGGCADQFPPVLGLSTPLWSLLCLSALALGGLTIYLLAPPRSR